MPSAAGPFDIGDPVLLTFNLTDTANSPVDASVPPVCTVTLPDLSTATPAVTHPGTGVYTAVYLTAQVGHHTVAWAATGTNPGGYTDSFDVWPAGDRSILSFADCKQSVNILPTVTQFDTELRQYNESITDFIEYYCGPVIQKPVTERLQVKGLSVALSEPPILTLTGMASVLTYGVAYPLNQLTFDPFTGIVRHIAGLPFFYGPYDFSYTCGRPVIPMGISMAARIILKHVWAIQRGGGAGAFGAGEEETNFEGFGFAVPNRALEMLEPYRSPGVVV